VTKLMEKMHEELVRRNYAETTIHTYERVVDDFRRFLGKRLDHAVPDDLRRLASPSHFRSRLTTCRSRLPHRPSRHPS